MRRVFASFSLLMACSVGSGDDSNSGLSTGASTTSTEGSTTGTGDGTEGTSQTNGDGDGDGDGDPPKLDVDPGHDITTGGDGDAGCKKIDFLFVIDNSNSMSDEQQLLISAFPDFADAIQQTLPMATDFHIGVTKTDIHGFDDSPTPDPNNPCSYELGGLLSHATNPGAKTGIGVDCQFSSGENYMTNSASLSDEFECAAAVGTKGNTGEKQAEATLAALSPAKAQPGQCSEGFLRDDALLVVTVITDEDDDWSAPDADAQTNAAAWFDGVVAAKNDIETNVVFLLISGGSPKWQGCGPLDLQNNTGADDSPKLTTWAKKFSNVEQGSVCEQGYAGYLAEAIGTIETACSEFEPPG